ncbi:MAG: N-acetyl-alpha-D-glucosaminyl L-malate synthase BshA [Candidatus Thorarchaeota archaeon]
MNLYPSVGGSGYVATRLGQHLAEMGHTIHFISYQRPFSLMWEQTPRVYVDLVDNFDYPLFKDVGSPYSMALASKMVKIVRGANLDLIHSHYAIPHAMSAFMTREITGTPYVVTLHGSDVHTLGIDPAYRPVVKYVIEKANAVTAVSEFLREKAYKELGIEREIEVIPNFIDVSKFTHLEGIHLTVESGCVALRNDTQNIDPEEKVILYASNFRPVKRVVNLIDVMRIVVDHHPRTRLIIAGDGPTRIDVERRIEKLNLCDNVHLLGIKSNMREIMCSADLFVLNSTLEGMPLVLLEAMSCRLPVITTPAGGIPELVRPGIDGMVTKTFEPEELAGLIIELLENDVKREAFGKAGRKRVEQSFAASKIVPMYEQVFQSVLS